MSAGTYNIELEQGATYTREVTVNDGAGDPIDISTWSMRGQVRSNYSASDILAEFTCTITDGANGVFQFELSAEQTSAICVKKGVYDIECERADGTVIRILKGSVEISPEVTR